MAGRIASYDVSASRAIGAEARFVSRRRDGTMMPALIITCAGGHEAELPVSKRYPPDALQKRLQSAGWDLRHKPVCPDCVKRIAAPRAAPMPLPPPPILVPTEPTMNNVTSITATPTTATLTDEARRAQRSAIQWLEEALEPTETGFRYKGDFSDRSIAAEVKLSEQKVAQLRESFFGPLSEPKILTDLKGDVEKLRGEIRTVERDAKAAIESISAKIVAVEQRIQRVAQQQGWASA